jgi:hypothetical protein
MIPKTNPRQAIKGIIKNFRFILNPPFLKNVEKRTSLSDETVFSPPFLKMNGFRTDYHFERLDQSKGVKDNPKKACKTIDIGTLF